MARVATVSSKGQVTLPVSVRKRLGLRRGSRIVFIEGVDEVRLLREEDLERLFDVFKKRGRNLHLTRKRLGDLVKKARSRLWKEHCARRR